MSAVDLVEALRRELAPPPPDLDSLHEKLEKVERLLARLAARDLAPPEALIDLAEVKARTGCGRTLLMEKVVAGLFPRPVERGDRILVWRASEVDAWIRSLPPRPLVGGSDAG